MIPSYLEGADDLVTYDPDERFEMEWPDGTIRMVIDRPAFDFHLDVREKALNFLVAGFRRHLERLGFIELDDVEPELTEDGYVRMYWTPKEPISNTDYAMPSLIPTGIGPYSMEIPAISPWMEEEEMAELEHEALVLADIPTAPVPLPPLPYGRPTPGPARYTTTMTGPRKRGRHRA